MEPVPRDSRMDKEPSIRRGFPGRRGIAGLALVLVAALVGEGLYRLGWLDLIEHWHYDLFHHVRGVRAQAAHVAIVSVDNEMLLQHRDEPLVFWGPHFAKAMEVLRRVGARVIGLDYLFAVSPEGWLRRMEAPEGTLSRTYDIPMREQLSRGSVVLIGVLASRDGDEGELILPVNDYLFSLPHGIEDVGLANFLTDPDGVVRRFVPALLDGDGAPSLSFATLLAVRASGLEPAAPWWNLGGRVVARNSGPMLIGFAGPPGTVMRVSMARLLAPAAEQDPAVRALEGRVVIVAAEHVGLQDLHLTPYAQSGLGREGRVMSGAEIHANICETLLSGRFPRPVSHGARLLSALLVVGFGAWVFLRMDPWKGLLGLMGLAMGCSFISYVWFLGDRVLAVAGSQVSLLVCFLGGLGLRLRGEERERQRLRRLFGRYVSQEVLERLLASGHRPDLGGEAVEVTVLFSDIRGFTNLSEVLGPHELVEVLNGFLGKACQAVLDEGGMVDKYVGDAVMAIFGWPIPYSDHAMRGLRAAQRMALAAREIGSWMGQRFAGRALPAFRIGVGLHTGLAVVGNIGSAQRMDFTAVGDTVNTASRIEGLSKELGWTIVASQATVQAAGAGLQVEGETQVQLRGKAASMKVYGIAVAASEKVER